MIVALSGGQVLLKDQFATAAVLLRGGLILDIVDEGAAPGDAVRHDVTGRRVVPGFIDTQVNGGGGVLFNDAPSVSGIRAIGAAHRRFGTTGFLPTLISDDISVIRTAIAAVDEAIALGVPGVMGIHIEGPFLNPAKRGIHDPAHIRKMDERAFDVLTGLRGGRTLVTIAPEMVDAAMIRRLWAAGVILAAGHTDASYEEMLDAYDAGVAGMTHLFNAMSPLAARAPGAVGAALATESIHCGLIVDGIHVHPATLRLALGIGPRERFMLVTDAMPPVGTQMEGFELAGQPIHVRDGRCVSADGTLAGAHLTMADAVRNCVSMLGVSDVEALDMASGAPARFLRLADHGRIAPGMAADLVALDGFSVTDTWIAGVHHDATSTG